MPHFLIACKRLVIHTNSIEVDPPEKWYPYNEDNPRQLRYANRATSPIDITHKRTVPVIFMKDQVQRKYLFSSHKQY